MMARRLSSLALVALLAGGAVTLRADSIPVIRGAIGGIELCPQSICGAAIFVGAFAGQVGPRLSIGSFAVVATHEDLPAPEETSAITGGAWQIKVPYATIDGSVAGGSLYNNGNNTFHVTVNMVFGGGSLVFNGLLNHNTFPPTLTGQITQH